MPGCGSERALPPLRGEEKLQAVGRRETGYSNFQGVGSWGRRPGGGRLGGDDPAMAVADADADADAGREEESWRAFPPLFIAVEF